MADLNAADGLKNVQPRTAEKPTREELLATATRIGERICEIAVLERDRATWLVSAFAGPARLVSTVAGYDLYNGLPGIALFLGHLGNITGNGRFCRIADAAMAEALAVYKATDDSQINVGAFEGVGGFAYALVRLGTILERPAWVIEATKMLRKAVKKAAGSPDLDIIFGLAGLIVSAVAVDHFTRDAALIRKLRPLANKLRKIAVGGKNGKALQQASLYAGLAHGRAGIGLALSRWAEATCDDGFREPATELINSDLEAIDARHSAPRGADPIRELRGDTLGWCRGLSGAGLGALRSNVTPSLIGKSGVTYFQGVADEIVSAGVEGPLCLCHGALGWMEFLATAARLGMLHNTKDANRWRHLVLNRIVGGDWVADQGHSLESPGLMLGLAGTGYALLRTSYPQRMPSVLTVDPGWGPQEQ